MALPPDQQAQVTQALDTFCDERVPLEVRDKVVLQYRIRGRDVVLFEKRPAFKRPGRWVEISVAKFRYTKGKGQWSLFWSDRDSKWHLYEDISATEEFNALLSEVDEDPTGIFWG